MVPARLNDARTRYADLTLVVHGLCIVIISRPIPLVEGTNDASDPPDVELAPLLVDDSNVWPSKMMLMKNPNTDLHVAVTPIIVPARPRNTSPSASSSTSATTVTYATSRQNRVFDSDVMF